MFPLNIHAYGKINLFLSVGGLREDGLHSIQTVFHKADVCDDITVEITDTPGISIACETEAVCGVCENSAVPTDGGNLIHKAISRFHEAIGRPIDELDHGYRITVVKRIPIAGGMGGGSADAGYVLAALNRELGELIAEPELVELASSLGSDVPFFLYGCDAMLAEEDGGNLRRCCPLPPCRMEFLSCGKKASTGEMYKALDLARGSCGSDAESQNGASIVGLLRALECSDWREIEKNLYNSFEGVFTGLSAENAVKFREISDQLREKGAAAVLLCGSGPTVCGIFPEQVG